MDRVGKGGISDRMAEEIAKLNDFIQELLEIILTEQEKQKVILEQLNKLEEPYRLLLDKAYIRGKSLVDVSEEMGYGYKHIGRINRIALGLFDKLDKEVLKSPSMS
ncbi:MAG: hypothetical protein FWF46_01490 [Oscillospiraceae bacterium]|nr:hypothetical protein [Oscillospiraceae bacterium]